MLERITAIRGHKCFRDFRWEQLPPFGRYNLIYGWNGSGKTTLSKLLGHLETRQPITTGQVAFSVSGTAFHGATLGQQSLPTVRVFNRDYVDGSVLQRNQNLEHIFFLGKRAVEKENERERVEQELKKIGDDWTLANGKQASARQDYDRFLRESASAIKQRLRAPGQNRFANYDKNDFETQCIRAEKGEIQPLELDDNTRDSLQKARQADARPSIQRSAAPLAIQGVLITRIRSLLKSTPTIAPIEALRSDSALSGWLGSGLGIHRDRNSEICLFCEQHLPKGRLERLEAHFSDSYRQFANAVGVLRSEVSGLQSQVAALPLVEPGLVYPQLVAQIQEANSDMKDSRDRLLAILADIADAIRKKLEHALLQVEVPESLSNLAASASEWQTKAHAVQAVVEQHNRITQNFNAEVASAGAQLELDAIANAFAEFKSRKRAMAEQDEELKALGLQRDALGKRVDELTRDLTETIEPANQLNDDLAAYLGHTELTITHHGTGYAITRSGQPANDLSEGERTGIALLYFLKSLEDHRRPLKNTIVVVDDPVSSLDAGALYAAFGYMRARTEGAKQLFILTHDFSLFHLVKGWFKHMKATTGFYQIRAPFAEGTKCSKLFELDPLLKDYDTEYQYLFSLVLKASTSQDNGLEQFYGMPNVARRTFEHFLAFRFPGGKASDHLQERVKSLNLEPGTAAVINRFLNINSHGDGVAPPEHDLHLLAEAPRVMKAVIEVMRKEDPNHVERMEALVASNCDQP
ncbi:MAG: AAA family ATPase [Betaproteobacteria bacterium]|nr:AAA family ATPase [Betaproteobacteria bacterium]